jgi:hypothetical protein
MKEYLKKALTAVVAYEKANARTIAALVATIATKSVYSKAVVSVALALLGIQNQ